MLFDVQAPREASEKELEIHNFLDSIDYQFVNSSE